MPASAVFSGRTAAHLHGAHALADVRTPVEVSVPAGVRFAPVAGLRVRETLLPAADVTHVGRRPCTTRVRTALDIARVDLAHPEQRVAVEYDGVWHADRAQLARDRRRLNALVAAGWTVLHVTAADLPDPDALVARVRTLLRARDSGGGAPPLR